MRRTILDDEAPSGILRPCAQRHSKAMCSEAFKGNAQRHPKAMRSVASKGHVLRGIQRPCAQWHPKAMRSEASKGNAQWHPKAMRSVASKGNALSGIQRQCPEASVRMSSSNERTSATGWGSSSSGTRGAIQRKHIVPHVWPTVSMWLPRKTPSAFGSECETSMVTAPGSSSSGRASVELVCTRWYLMREVIKSNQRSSELGVAPDEASSSCVRDGTGSQVTPSSGC